MAARIIAALAFPMMLTACGDPCSSELLLISASPHGFAQASFYRTNCGATTAYRYEVRVSRRTEATGNTVLRFDDNHARDWVDDDRNLLDMSWVGDTNLKVRVSKPIRIFDEEESVDGVGINFDFAEGSVRL